jgi:polysaccharide biosynthesis protein PslH
MFGLTSSLLGNIDGVNEQSLKRLLEAIDYYSIGRVFIDGSNLGLAAKAIKSVYPSVDVVIFFHNCEARFFLGALRQRPSVRACGVLLANYLAERSAVLFSDKRICLNQRDSNLLHRVYGRGATHISPMAMQDQLPHGPVDPPVEPGEPYALFVGGTFYANRQGIEWYVDNVAARAPIPVYVVGKGFERWKDRLERKGNVKVIGAVDSLAPWYLGAQFVIAPIFDGSGMKTKVAESLMFGKRVIGTPEAFVGYEEVARDIGAVCATADEFIVALNNENSQSPPFIDPRLRSIYEEKYSYDAAKRRLAAILDACP